MRPARRFLWALAGLGGCVPSLPALLAEHQHGEALCAATDADAATGDDERALAAFAREFMPAAHLRALTRDELRAAVGDPGERLYESHEVLLVTTWLRRPMGMHGALDARVDGTAITVDLATLARLTGEVLPSPRTVTTSAGLSARLEAARRSPGGLAAGIGEVLTLGTIPFMEIFGQVPPARSTVEPPDEAEVRAAAPAASALFAALRARTDPTRGAYREAVLLPRSATAALTLRVSLRWTAHGDGVFCALGMDYALPLGPVTGLGERLRARFGAAVVPLDALGATRTRRHP